jgi:hypothetical protein
MATDAKLPGFTADTIAALEAAGWIRGTECGYPNHTGFVHGTKDGYSLTAGEQSGTFLLAKITNGLCERKSYNTLAEVLAYFG